MGKYAANSGARPKDDIILGGDITIKAGGPNPEKTDRVMLRRHRVSRILFMENFYINRFGRKLYSMFFEYYTENLWGRHPREIDASWGNQRVKGLSISAVIKDIFGKVFRKKNRKVETSLIEEFSYPKLGPGQLWEVTADDVLDSHIERVKKAYPAYFVTYSEIDTLIHYLNTIPNLYCVGRNGQHRYNNIDHSMCTSFEAVKNIVQGISSKDNIWAVNTEAEYHETEKVC